MYDKVYSAKCIRQSSKLTVGPNEFFKVSWTYQNTGDNTWPLRGVFTKSEGHYSFNCKQELFLSTRPQKTVWIEVQLRSPASPGVYRANFRLFHSGNVVFGDEATLHIAVVQSSNTKLAGAGPMSNNTVLRNSYFDESSSSPAAREDVESEGPKKMWSDVDQVTMAHNRYVERVNSSNMELLSKEEK